MAHQFKVELSALNYTFSGAGVETEVISPIWVKVITLFLQCMQPWTECSPYSCAITIYIFLQALNSRIYNTSQLPVVQPSLTFEQENQLRGIHRCDVISATSAESFRFRVENVARLFRTTAENAFSDVSIPEIRSCPFGDRFFDSCDTTRRPLTTFSAQHDCNISANTTAVYSRGFLAGVIPVLNFSINAFGPGSVSMYLYIIVGSITSILAGILTNILTSILISKLMLLIYIAAKNMWCLMTFMCLRMQ